MDNQTLVATIKSARDFISSLDEKLGEERWRQLISLDHALNSLNDQPSDEARSLVVDYARNLGRLQGMIRALKERHDFLGLDYAPVGAMAYSERLRDLGRDVWMMMTLLESKNETDQQK